MTHRRTHTAIKSELVRTNAGLMFRARCSCGWTGGPVDASQVVVDWEAHISKAEASRAGGREPDALRHERIVDSYAVIEDPCVARCSCGWSSPPVPNAEFASQAWERHRSQAADAGRPQEDP